MNNKEFGSAGEQHAATYLLGKGYQILETNASSRWGEIDLICKKAGKYIFVEVKSRTSDQYGKPFEAVTYSKIRHLVRSMKYYILSNNLEKMKFQLDVIGIIFTNSRGVMELKHYENLDVRV